MDGSVVQLNHGISLKPKVCQGSQPTAEVESGRIQVKNTLKDTNILVIRDPELWIQGSLKFDCSWMVILSWAFLDIKGKKGLSFSTYDFIKLTVALEFLFALIFDLQQELWSTLFTFWCHWCREKNGKIFNMYKWAYLLKEVTDWFVQLRI